jgi:RNA polymerase sigma factor (sigma-70 family)
VRSRRDVVVVGYLAVHHGAANSPSLRSIGEADEVESSHTHCSPVTSIGDRDARLASLARSGDGSALEALLASYRPLLASVAAEPSYLPPGIERADVEQEAACAFCQLVLAYDRTRNVPLAAYLKAKLRWRVAHFLRGERRRTGHLNLDEVDLDSIEAAIVEMPSPSIVSPRVARAIRRLSPRQRAVIAGLFWRERKASELAVELGVSHQAVASLRRRAEASIRRELSAEPRESV